MRLADFIVAEMESILQEWEDFARTLKPAALNMTDRDLRNHAARMLEIIAKDLRTSQTDEQQVEKSHGSGPQKDDAGHGIARHKSEFTVEQLVSEYRALRSSVLRLWGKSLPSGSRADAQDITRFHEAIDQLLAESVFTFAEAKRMAEATEKNRRDQFLAMLGHELRNPLSPITMASAVLRKAKGNEQVIENATNVIARQTLHMASLLDDLLDVSRVTRGLIEVKLKAVDIREVIDEAVEQVTPQIEARRHRLDVTGPPRPTVVMAEKKRLVQVVSNLLVNAAKYTPEGGHIQLEMRLIDAQVVITVEDNGVGMPPEFIAHAFELFAQVEQSSDRSTGGLGLGLALVRNLVELHGGSVSCMSKGLGKGSCFTVALPRRENGDEDLKRIGAPVA